MITKSHRWMIRATRRWISTERSGATRPTRRPRTRHAGYAISQQKRKRVEEIFGWMKTVGGMRKLRHRGLELVGWMFTFAAAAYNLVRIRNLSTAVAGGKA